MASATAVLSVPGHAAPAGSRNDDTRAVYLSALDASGAPIRDLTAADLSVREDDQAEPIVSLSPATAKMSIAVLVDDSGVGIDQFRLGIARLMNRLILDAEFSLVGIAGQNQTLLEFTQQSDKLVPAVRGLKVRLGPPGQHVIEAVGEALASEQRREAVRPIVIVLTNESREAGSGAGGGVLDRFARAGAVLQVVEVVQPLRRAATGGSGDLHAFARENDASDTDRARSQLLNDGPVATGGDRHQLLDVAGVPATLSAIAEALAAQYVLVFRSGATSADPSKIAVATTRPGVKLHVPARAGTRRIR